MNTDVLIGRRIKSSIVPGTIVSADAANYACYGYRSSAIIVTIRFDDGSQTSATMLSLYSPAAHRDSNIFRLEHPVPEVQ